MEPKGIWNNICGRASQWTIPPERHRVLVVLAFAVALLVRLLYAGAVQHPGHGDSAFYYNLAENLVDGKGFQIDYIWHYLTKPENITHPAVDYWMPLSSIIMSLPMFLVGKSLFAALSATIIFGLALSVLTYYISRYYADSRFVAYGSAVLVLYSPILFRSAVVTDSVVFNALFVCSSLYLMARGFENRFLFPSALCAGLAYLTRQDAILLLPTLFGVVLLSPEAVKTKIKYLSVYLVVYLLTISPQLIANYKMFGSLFLPAPSRTFFLTEYEDLYSYSKELSLRTYLDWGIYNIAASKIRAIVRNVGIFYQDGGIFAAVATLELVLLRRRKEWRVFLPFVLFIGFSFLFYSFVGTIHTRGSYVKTLMPVIPVFVIISVAAIERHFQRNASLIVALMVLILVPAIVHSARHVPNGGSAKRLASLNEVLKGCSAKYGDEIVIMTRDPWEVTYSTRHKAVQVPNEDMDTIYRVAQRYRANYLLLPARRKALEGLYKGTLSDERFEFIAPVGDSNWKLFRIKSGFLPEGRTT